MAFEGIEVAQARRPQDRRAEVDDARRQDRLVIGLGSGVALDDLGERLDAKAARKVIVQRGDGLPEEGRVVRLLRILHDQALARLLEVEPVLCGGVARCRKPPGRASRCIALANVRDLHGLGV